MEHTNCIVCDENKSELLYSGFDRLFGIEGEFKVVTCLNCGFVYLNPRLSAMEVELYYPAQYYSFQKWTEDVGFLKRSYRKIKWKFLSQINMMRVPGVPKFIKNGRILDFGCGTGACLLAGKSMCLNQVIGVDISDSALKVCVNQGLEELVKYDGSGVLNIQDNSIGTIHSSQVIEHIPREESDKLLLEFYLVLL